MNNQSGQNPEFEKYAVVPARLEEFRKIWRHLKSSLTDSLNSLRQYGRSLVKVSHNLHFSFNHSDPSFICQFTLNLLTRQAKTSQLLMNSLDEISKTIFIDVENYEETLEQARVQTLEMLNEGLKQVMLARVNHAKERANYERLWKEAEALIQEKRKAAADPVAYYNLTHKRRMRTKINEALKNVRQAEKQLQDAIEFYNIRQTSFNSFLGKSMHTFRDTLKSLLKNVHESLLKHNKMLLECFQKEMQDLETSGALTAIPTENTNPLTNEAQQQYIEQRKLKGLAPADSPKDTVVNTEGQADVKGKFTEMQVKLTQNVEEVTDAELLGYVDLAQKHFEVSVAVFDERNKVVKNLRIYLQEFAKLCSMIEQAFAKLAKSPVTPLCATTSGKRVGTTLDPVFLAFWSFGACFQQFTTGINVKAPMLDGMIKDQAEHMKNFQQTFARSMKPYFATKNNIGTTDQQIEKISKEIFEISEADQNDERLLGHKTTLEGLKKVKEEQIAELRKNTVEAANGIVQVYENYKAKEYEKFVEFGNVIRGLTEQEHVLFKSLSVIAASVVAEQKTEEAIATEVQQVLEADDVLSGYLHYLKTGENAEEGEQKGKGEKVFTEYPLSVPKPFALPEDLQNEQEEQVVVPEVEEQETTEAEEGSIELKFGLKMGTKHMDYFTCGVEQGIIRQGNMYLYPNLICFSTSKLLGSIRLMIPVEDITKIEKKTMSLVFDNALSIITKKGEVKFTSFFSRDKAYNMIVSLMKSADEERRNKKEAEDKKTEAPAVVQNGEDASPKQGEKQEETKTEEADETKKRRGSLKLEPTSSDEENKKVPEVQEKKTEGEVTTEATTQAKPVENQAAAVTEKAEKKEDKKVEEVPKKSQEEEEAQERQKYLQMIEKRKEKIRPSLMSDDNFTLVMGEGVYDCSALDLFHVIFSDRKTKINGRVYDSFWMALKLGINDTDIKPTKWSPEPPYEGMVTNKPDLKILKKIANGAEKSSRNYVYTHPVDGGPFVPKSCCVEERHTGYWLGVDEFVMQNEVQTSKIPMSDCFVVRNCYKVKEIGNGKCKFVWTFGLQFLKSTMFKSKISKSSQEESQAFSKNLFMPMLRDNLAGYLKEKEFELQKRAADEAKKKEEQAVAKEKEKVTVETVDTTVNAVEKPEVEGEKEEAKSPTDGDVSTKEEESRKRETVSLPSPGLVMGDEMKEEFSRFVKAAEAERESMRNEISGLKKLIFALIAINSFAILYVFFRSGNSAAVSV